MFLKSITKNTHIKMLAKTSCCCAMTLLKTSICTLSFDAITTLCVTPMHLYVMSVLHQLCCQVALDVPVTQILWDHNKCKATIIQHILLINWWVLWLLLMLWILFIIKIKCTFTSQYYYLDSKTGCIEIIIMPMMMLKKNLYGWIRTYRH